MKKIVALILSFVFFMSCAGMSQLNPANLKGNHARARFVNVTYSMAFLDYQKYAALPNLTPEAIQLLKTKRHVIANLHLPISILNGHAETGLITDAMFQALLDKLLELEMGWYTDPQKMTTMKLDSKIKDSHLKRAAVEAGLVAETTAQIDPMFMGVLLELLRAGIHAVRALISQRNLDEAQMKAAWEASWTQFKTLDPNTLIVLE